MPNQPSTSAKILYRPVGLISSVLGGVIAGTIFKQVWKRAAPGTKDDPPKALETEYPFKRYCWPPRCRERYSRSSRQ